MQPATLIARMVRAIVAASLTGTLLLGGANDGQAATNTPASHRAVAAQDAPPAPGERAEHDGDPNAVVEPMDDLVAARKAYLTLLFQEVNVRRDRASSPPFEIMLDSGNEAVNTYLFELTPLMEQRHACFHGSDVVGLRAGWDYLPEYGVDEQVGGEVLACPDVEAGGFWTPPGIADGWWQSPHHFSTLYADQRPIAVACGAYNQVVGKNAFETVACITLLTGGQP